MTQDRIDFLKKWGSFTDEQVKNYPWSMIDVITIMKEYKDSQTQYFKDEINRLELVAQDFTNAAKNQTLRTKELEMLLDEAIQIIENVEEVMTRATVKTDLPQWLLKARSKL